MICENDYSIRTPYDLMTNNVIIHARNKDIISFIIVTKEATTIVFYILLV